MTVASPRVASFVVESGPSVGAVAVAQPRLSWTTAVATDNWVQAGAEIELDGQQTARIDAAHSVLQPWPFAPLVPHARHTARVRVTGVDGGVSAWSEPIEIRSSFMADGEWVAEPIGLAFPEKDAQPFRARRAFEVREGLARGVLFATAHGAYEARINGAAVDDQILKPGWTPYRQRLIHETTDVTSLLDAGSNVLAADVAGGWYTQGFFLPHPRYGAQPAVALQLRLEYTDGSIDTIASDASWKVTGDSPLVRSSIYVGEHWDARLDTPGWDRPGFDDAAWQAVRFMEPMTTPSARTSPAVRAIEELPVDKVLTSASGAQLLDFGQNLVGWVRLRLRGAAGTIVTVRHAEVLEDGELGLRPLRGATSTETYVLAGDGVEISQPKFTFHGFRFAQITGLDSAIDPADVTAVVIHSDMRRTGWFESSHPLLDRLHENVVWGMRGNFLYLPTDCPQRDERMGWTGDIQVFAPTASFLYDSNGFLSSWLHDLALEQTELDGMVPIMVPIAAGDAKRGVAAWGDAATVVPTVLHDRFGDTGVLRTQFASMRDWTDFAANLASDNGLWDTGFQYGDWLDPNAPPEDPYLAITDKGMVATAYLIRSADLTTQAAALLGESTDAQRFAALAERTRNAFLAAYIAPSGAMLSETQTAYALALAFDIARDDALRARLAQRLADIVAANDYRIGTGFVGTPIIAEALANNGHLDVAARLLLQTAGPSWLHPVTMGATTIWERWDSMLDDGTINPGEMTSFNHYALGAVADWMHRSVAGLAPARPGYERVLIEPRPIAGLDHARARLDSPYGPVSVGWRRDGERIVVEATIAPNTRAEVRLPGRTESFDVGSGNHAWICAPPVETTN